jgi:hypothetical protein
MVVSNTDESDLAGLLVCCRWRGRGVSSPRLDVRSHSTAVRSQDTISLLDTQSMFPREGIGDVGAGPWLLFPRRFVGKEKNSERMSFMHRLFVGFFLKKAITTFRADRISFLIPLDFILHHPDFSHNINLCLLVGRFLPSPSFLVFLRFLFYFILLTSSELNNELDCMVENHVALHCGFIFISHSLTRKDELVMVIERHRKESWIYRTAPRSSRGYFLKSTETANGTGILRTGNEISMRVV